MFVVELVFGADQERLAARPAHRERLQRLHEDGTLHMAGPFVDDSGALLIFDVPDEEALEGILADDQYYGTPGVTVARRQQWSPIVGA
ncbi:MAG: YciI family protein [Acidimicrobiales bacterium]